MVINLDEEETEEDDNFEYAPNGWVLEDLEEE